MTNPANLLQPEAGSGDIHRRGLLKTAAALAATSMIAPQALARDFGRGAEPQRYPDPDIVVIDPKRFKAKVGNTAIKRLYTGCLWAEGPAWHAQGQYLVWSDIPSQPPACAISMMTATFPSSSTSRPTKPTATPSISRAGRSAPNGPG